MAGVTALNNTAAVNQGTPTQAAGNFELNRETGQLSYTVRAGDTLGKIRANANAFARANGLTLAPGQSVVQIARQSGIANADRVQIGQTLTINTGGVQAEVTPTPVCDSTPAEPEPADNARVTNPNIGPIYNPATAPDPRLESQTKFTGSFADGRRAFAEQIFTTLQREGVISADARFSTWFGGGEGRDITNLISDADRDGYFEVNANDLYSLLRENGVMAKNKGAFNLALSPITTRFFAEDAAATHQAAGPSGSVAAMSPQEFEIYVRDNYSGKLCGNPELQAAFTRDLESFMAGHFTGAIDGVQVDVNDKYNWRPGNDGQLSADAAGRRRADCGVYADASAYYMKAAGMKVSYYGSYINTGTVSGGHVQAVGYLPGGDFTVANNNGSVTGTNQRYSLRNGEALVRQTLTASHSAGGFGSDTQVYQIFPGVRSAAAVVTLQQQAIARNVSLANLQDAVNAYSRYEGGLHFITEASTEQVMARAESARNRAPSLQDSPKGLRNTDIWGRTTEELTFNILKSKYLGELNKMETALNNLQDISGSLESSDFPLSINVDNGESSSRMTFNSKAELDSYVTEQLIFVDQARASIDNHLAILE
jgi:hypothetical protein